MRGVLIFALAVGAILVLGVVGCEGETAPEGEDESPYSYWCWWAKAAMDLHAIDRQLLLSTGLETGYADETVREIEKQYHEDCREGYVVHWGANIRELCKRAAESRRMALDAYREVISDIRYMVFENYSQWMRAYCSMPGLK